jgi:hypothetical protein
LSGGHLPAVSAACREPGAVERGEYPMFEPTACDTLMDRPVPSRRATLIEALEVAASEALVKVRQFRQQGNFKVAGLYADLAETRTAHLKLLLAEQAGCAPQVLMA